MARLPTTRGKCIFYRCYEASYDGVPLHYGVTNGRLRLTRFPDAKLDTWEQFDLKSDPMDMKSRNGDQGFSGAIDLLKTELKRLRAHYKVES